MRKNLLLGLLFLVGQAGVLLAQVQQEWLARYPGLRNNLNVAEALSVDSLGHVYVTGTSAGPRGVTDYATVKYDAQGNELWVARYDGPDGLYDYGRALAVDAAGYVYVTGDSGSHVQAYDYATIKYDPEGNALWVARYNGPGNADDHVTSLALDATGHVYVTGWSGSIFNTDYVTVKYDPDGNEAWVARYNGPGNGSDVASALALDAAGYVYVTGFSCSTATLWCPNSTDYATVKYDPEGNELWVARYNGPGDNRDEPMAFAVGAAGNVYVTGQSFNPARNWHYATVKYDTDGNQRWVAYHYGRENTWTIPFAIAVDGQGNAYVTGASDMVCALKCTAANYATVKYDPEGNELWVARYESPGRGFDQARSIVVDWAGNVYVTGYSWGGLDTRQDYATIKYDAEGVCSVSEFSRQI